MSCQKVEVTYEWPYMHICNPNREWEISRDVSDKGSVSAIIEKIRYNPKFAT